MTSLHFSGRFEYATGQNQKTLNQAWGPEEAQVYGQLAKTVKSTLSNAMTVRLQHLGTPTEGEQADFITITKNISSDRRQTAEVILNMCLSVAPKAKPGKQKVNEFAQAALKIAESLDQSGHIPTIPQQFRPGYSLVEPGKADILPDDPSTDPR